MFYTECGFLSIWRYSEGLPWILSFKQLLDKVCTLTGREELRDRKVPLDHLLIPPGRAEDGEEITLLFDLKSLTSTGLDFVQGCLSPSL